MTFENLNLIEPILQAVKSEGYTHPTPIQAQAIPIILSRKDLLGCAQTGTGKTAAFAIPIMQLLNEKPSPKDVKRNVRCLVLTPTRELAIQIGESFTNYGRNLNLRNKVIFGGVSQKGQVDALRAGIDILIATPGRLLDLMNQNYVTLRNIEFLVLDEADRMLDMGFVHDVKKIIAKVPMQKQTLFFSATMPKDIVHLANSILNNPEKVEVTPVSSTAETINQCVYFVDKDNKKDLLIDILRDKSIERVLVFTRTKHGADRVTKELTKVGIMTQAIHGNKSQNARQNALNNFKSKFTRVLVATDIAARGIDIDELTHVINYELPNIPESYVHRIGRTGRAGADGTAIAFCDYEEKSFLIDIEKVIGLRIFEIEDHPYPMKNFTIPKKEARPARPQRTNNGRSANTRTEDTVERNTSGNWNGSTKKPSTPNKFFSKRKY
jgi:ATP-dependent RNA helicase RhlE